MRKYGRIDDNQAEIVRCLRKCGATVQSLASIGSGCPDLLVGYRGVWYVLEVKDGNKPPSKRKLTEEEEKWIEAAKGPVSIVFGSGDAMRAIGAIR